MNRIVSWGVRKVNRLDRLTLQVVTFILLHLIIHVAHQFSRRASFLLHPVQHSESEKPLFFSIYSSFSFGLLAMRGNECAMLGIGDGCVLHAFLLAHPCCDLDLIYYISEGMRRLPILGKGGWMKSEFFLKQAS